MHSSQGGAEPSPGHGEELRERVAMSAEARSAKRFHERVYALVRQVPSGCVTTYGTIALALGAPGCARRVGAALAALRGGQDVPAHRVVNRSGELTGAHAFGAPGTMRALLEAEGVTFDGEGRVRLRDHLWEPPSNSTNSGRVDVGRARY